MRKKNQKNLKESRRNKRRKKNWTRKFWSSDNKWRRVMI